MSSCTRWVNHTEIDFTYWTRGTTDACRRWADRGSQRCQLWADLQHGRCCGWTPCSWFCDAGVWVSHWICQAWYRIANLVCAAVLWIVFAVALAFSWVGDWICIAWDTTRCFIRHAPTRGKAVPEGPVKHVFVLMLENRAFDHMLGFSGIAGTDAATGQPVRLDGLVGNPHSNVDPDTNQPVFAATPADFNFKPPEVDPDHEFPGVVVQLCGANATYPDRQTHAYPPINNSGFIESYKHSGKPGDTPTPPYIMKCFAPDQVPVITELARSFAVCDHWFSSMPGPTWPNRFFIHAASSGGLDGSPSDLQTVTSVLFDGFRFENGTIYDRLEDKCLGWNVFMGDENPQVFAVSGMAEQRLIDRFYSLDEFAATVNDPDFSTPYCFIEPNYGNLLPLTPGDFTCGSSQHPLDDVTRGERLIKQVYETIRNSPHWENSLLVVTYDEHGGFYDHVAPPPAVNPGDRITDPVNNQHHFDFTQLGVRVPAVVISPRIPANVIDKTVYDHTSLLATVEKLFGLEPLTERDRTASTFDHLLSLPVARTDAPLSLPDPPDSNFHCEHDAMMPPAPGVRVALAEKTRRAPIEPILMAFAHVAFLRDYHQKHPLAKNTCVRRFLQIRTKADALEYIQDVASDMKSRRWSRKQRTDPVPK